MTGRRAYILCRFAHQSSLYQSWLGSLPMPHEIVRDAPTSWVPPNDASIVITHMHYRWDEIHALRRICEIGRTPVLILADGILEYRNIYQHPDLADGSVFQPLVGHKLACIGRGQARIVEAWGNVGKCEVVGLPRLDSLISATAHAAKSNIEQFSLVIATANTPAFNQKQREAVIESLSHIRSRLSNNSRVNGRVCKVHWRLTDGFDDEIGLSEAEKSESLETPLTELLRQTDAVITTPSTLYLESLLLGKPTALLDFHNTPHFVPAAWMINAPKHVNAILNELASPPGPKMLFQNITLHDQLECETPATPRMVELILSMVEAGENARSQNSILDFAPRILRDQRHGFSVVEQGFALKDLFPENSVLRNWDLETLQLELNLVLKRVNELPVQNAELYRRLTETRKSYDEMTKRYENTRERLYEARARIENLKKKLGLPTNSKSAPELEDE